MHVAVGALEGQSPETFDDHLVRESDTQRKVAADRVLDGTGLGREHRRVPRLNGHDGGTEVEVPDLTTHYREHRQRVRTEDL